MVGGSVGTAVGVSVGNGVAVSEGMGVLVRIGVADVISRVAAGCSGGPHELSMNEQAINKTITV
ncbi:MAG: hypothetical protein A2032_02475 [Chloroflexi bacterium RBG_19FT_COMBO_49_13]|nr:MAG: hypothetical protein A2032_02475 [Chloroflexi bacterium RBG_19FT_COMBO_49_13]